MSHDLEELFRQPWFDLAAERERYGILLAAALHHALEGDIQRARRLSQDVRVMGKPIPELNDQELRYIEETYLP